MAVSIDRYIGVTRPLNYSSIMTRRRTVYLIILVWAISILTSVVPLFGLTDRGQKTKGSDMNNERSEICIVNKNTFYTIFSSMVSFYIPVIILLILYSRVYQEAKRQGEKLENEKRRLYQIDYQIASEQVRQEETHPQHSNGHLKSIRQNSNDHEQEFLTHDNASDEDDHSDQMSMTNNNNGNSVKKGKKKEKVICSWKMSSTISS